MHRQLLQLKNQNGGIELNPTNFNTEKSVTESYGKYELRANFITKLNHTFNRNKRIRNEITRF